MWIALLWAVATATLCRDSDVCCNNSMVPDDAVYYNHTCAGSVCTVGECCLAPQSCGDFGRCSSCPSGNINSSQPCSGASCNNVTCCQPYQYCYEVPSCPLGQYRDMYASCTAPNCNAAACCRPPQTCYEAASSGVIDYACNATGYTFAQEANCTDCSVNTCCRLIQTCGEARDKDSKFCDRSNLTLSNYSQNCSVPGSCTVAECCSAPANCNDWSSLSIAPALCYPLGLVPDGNYSISCPCNAPQCCRAPQSCYEADVGSLLRNACAAVGKTLNYGGQCNGSVPCNTATCCSPVNSCSEFNYNIYPNPCMTVGKVPDTTGLCGNSSAPCSVDVCCRVPTNCYEISCPGDLRNLYGSCTDCSVATCCRPPVCGDQYYINCTGGQILNYNKSCASGTPCDAAFCCEAITSCGQLRGTSFDPCTLLYPQQVINPTVACTPPNCDTRCCKTPSTCAEYNSAGGRCDFPLVPSSTTTQCNGPCDDQECCRPAAACSELSYYYCSGLTMLNSSRLCPGPGMCTQAICCVPVTRCTDAVGLYSYCQSRGQIANPYGNGTVANGGCCRDPTNCGDAASLVVSGSFCGIYGALNPSVPCSGATCTQQTCCVRPPDCLSTIMSVDYGFCSRSGLVFNSSVSGNCSQTPCTVAECCRRPQFCGESATNSSQAQSSSTENPCPGGFPAYGEPCTSCGASECCRGPMTCEEAAQARPGLCSVPTFPIVNKSCSGATCGATDCCARLTKCPGEQASNYSDSGDSASDFFCYQNSMVPDKDKAGNSCGGNCVAADCCKPASNCQEGYILLYTCLDGDFVNANQTCAGASCNRATCCRQRPAPTYCAEYFYGAQSTEAICGTNFYDFNQISTSCNGAADCQAKCCRPVMGCIEAYSKNPRLCDGVGLPPVEPTTCQGAACTASKCCYAPTTCGELQRSNPDTCDSTTQVFDEAKATTTCPCNPTKCCRAPATCEEQSRASATFQCPAGQFMIPGQTCSGACTLVQCCTAATVCRELGVSVCTAARPLSNASADAKTCPCDATSCCRPYDSCLEAFRIDAASVCTGDFEPDSSKLNAACNGNCGTACCKKKDTHAPTPAPTTQPPTTAGCVSFEAYFQNVSRDCSNSDFTPDGLCTPLCSKSAVAVFPAFRNSTIALAEFNGCLDALLGPRFSSTVLAYLREKLHIAGICTGTTASSGYAIAPPVLLLSGMLLL